MDWVDERRGGCRGERRVLSLLSAVQTTSPTVSCLRGLQQNHISHYISAFSEHFLWDFEDPMHLKPDLRRVCTRLEMDNAAYVIARNFDQDDV